MEKKPSIFEYLDYRLFLKELYLFFKENEKFSLRIFARKAGFGSHSTLAKIIDGERNLTLESAAKVSKGFEFTENEKLYLELLVQLKVAETLTDRTQIYQQLAQIHPSVDLPQIAKEHLHLFKDWYVFAIRELVAADTFLEDPAKISADLLHRVTIEQVKDALRLLLDAGYLKRDENGKLEQSEPDITTGVETDYFWIANYHNQMILNGSRALEETPARFRDISSLSFMLTQNQYDAVKSRIQGFRRELLEFVRLEQGLEDGGQNGQSLYSINIQLFNSGSLNFGDNDDT